jgi:hypothetical protein
MAEYRFSWALFDGTGSITVNGDVPQPYYEEGTSLTILGTFDSGFTLSSYDINNGFLSSATNPWTFDMPSRDIKLRVNLTGSYTPSDTDYELKYFTETCDQSNQLIRVEIYEFGYVGSATQKDSAGFSFRWGNFGQDELEPIVRSFFNFGLVGMRDEYFELLEGGYRKWQVKVLIDRTNTNIANWQQGGSTSNSLLSVAYGDGKFVASRSNGISNGVNVSTDGIIWNSYSPASLLIGGKIIYANGLFVNAGFYQDNLTLHTSINGISWTQRLSGNVDPGEFIYVDLAFGNGLFLMIQELNNNAKIIWKSTNGTSWSVVTFLDEYDSIATGIAYGNGIWVIVTSGSPGTMLTSPDGETWTNQNTGISSLALHYANGVFTTGKHYSTDGITWNTATNSQTPINITYGNGYFYAVTQNNSIFSYSKDGINWTSVNSATTNSWTSIAYGDNKFITVGNSPSNYLEFENPLFWKGYINNSTLTINEVGIKEVMEFTASDGLNAFDSKRVVDQYFAGFAGGTMLGGLFGAINQTYQELRPINLACEIYETRLDRDDSVFEQLLIPANAVYTDGDTPLYYGNGEIAENTSVYISDFITALLKPFLCRIFLWRDEFYVISLPELAKDSYRLFNFNNNAEFEGISTITPGMDVSCKFTAGQRTGRPVYTEFTGTLELGVLDYSSRGGIYEEPFSVDSWIYSSPVSPYPNIYYLRAWNYVNAIPSNQPSSYPSGTNPARIQYVSDSLGEYAKLWGTSSVSGIADTALSFIELDSTRTGQDIPIAQDLANTLSFQLEFIFEPRSSTDPVRVNTNAGVQIRIGDSYLSFNGVDTFTWTTTPTIMQFPMTGLYAWNKLDIVNVVVPEDGAVIIRLYEVLTTNASSVDRYTVGYRNMSLKIEENDAFATEEISEKFVTDESYSNVYEEVKFKIGDVDTENSSSAIRLDMVGYGNPNSQAWSRDGVESLPLIQIFLQELANIKGRQNPRLILTLPRNAANPLEIKPYQNIEYDGHYWMVVAMDVDLMANSWRLELARLGEIGS